MRYRLRSLLVVLALGPPILAGAWLWWIPGRTAPARAAGPVIYHARFLGNRRYSDTKFRRAIGLPKGIRLNPDSAEAARQKIIEVYQRGSYQLVEVDLVTGGKMGDTELAFQIRERGVAPTKDE